MLPHLESPQRPEVAQAVLQAVSAQRPAARAAQLQSQVQGLQRGEPGHPGEVALVLLKHETRGYAGARFVQWAVMILHVHLEQAPISVAVARSISCLSQA